MIFYQCDMQHGMPDNKDRENGQAKSSIRPDPGSGTPAGEGCRAGGGHEAPRRIVQKVLPIIDVWNAIRYNGSS